MKHVLSVYVENQPGALLRGLRLHAQNGFTARALEHGFIRADAPAKKVHKTRQRAFEIILRNDHAAAHKGGVAVLPWQALFRHDADAAQLFFTLAYAGVVAFFCNGAEAETNEQQYCKQQ